MKRILCGVVLAALLLLPALGLTEGDDTIQLARTLYTLGRDESFDTMIMLGNVVMNRVESSWYPDSIDGVISQPHQFPHGTLYDDEALRAAREVMRGRRILPESVLRYCDLEAAGLMEEAALYTTSGSYAFYSGK